MAISWTISPSPKLTLNLGLRYDIFTPMVEQHNRIANFNLLRVN
jgi:hypothetical protein